MAKTAKEHGTPTAAAAAQKAIHTACEIAERYGWRLGGHEKSAFQPVLTRLNEAKASIDALNGGEPGE